MAIGCRWPFPFLGGLPVNQCAIFIDGGYFAKVTEVKFHRAKVDFQKLSDVLAGSVHRLRTYYYDCMPYQGNPPSPQERQKYTDKAKFFHAITRCVQRFQLRQGRPRKTGGAYLSKSESMYCSA